MFRSGTLRQTPQGCLWSSLQQSSEGLGNPPQHHLQQSGIPEDMAVPRVVPGSENPVGGEIQGSSKGTLRCLELDAVAEGSMKVSRDTNLYRFTQLYV